MRRGKCVPGPDSLTLVGLGLSLTLIVSCARAQGSPVVQPGDIRLNTSWIRPYTQRFSIEYIPAESNDSRKPETVGTLIETLRVLEKGNDSVFLYVVTRVYPGLSTETDSLLMERTTLAPIHWRTHRTRTHYRGGIDFDGLSVQHFGRSPEENVDTVLTHRAFLRGEESLLLPTLIRIDSLRTPLRVSRIEYLDTDWAFFVTDQGLYLHATAGESNYHRQSMWHLIFGRDAYWIDRTSMRLVRWELRPMDGGGVTRFVRIAR
jgi:hypothetical protein